jgi:hypothetical protein
VLLPILNLEQPIRSRVPSQPEVSRNRGTSARARFLLIAAFTAAAQAACTCVPCPEGYACTLGHCQQIPGYQPPDLTPPVSDASSPEDSFTPLDGPMASDGGPLDLEAARDLRAPPDLSPSCVPTGGSCYYHRDSICCSHYCVYETNDCR